jgi:hypothetical protein
MAQAEDDRKGGEEIPAMGGNGGEPVGRESVAEEQGELEEGRGEGAREEVEVGVGDGDALEVERGEGGEGRASDGGSPWAEGGRRPAWREEVEVGEARAGLEEEGPRAGEAARGANGGGGEDVADGDGVARGGLGAVPGTADEGGCAPVRRRVEELEHRLEHVVEDLVRGRRRGGRARRRVGLGLHLRALRQRLVLVLRHHQEGERRGGRRGLQPTRVETGEAAGAGCEVYLCLAGAWCTHATPLTLRRAVDP